MAEVLIMPALQEDSKPTPLWENAHKDGYPQTFPQNLDLRQFVANEYRNRKDENLVALLQLY